MTTNWVKINKIQSLKKTLKVKNNPVENRANVLLFLQNALENITNSTNNEYEMPKAYLMINPRSGSNQKW